MMLTGVGGILSCAHEPINADIFGGELHGHSYEIIAWFTNDEGADVRIFQASLNTLLMLWDHKVLPEYLATAEQIACAVGTLAKCVEVEVRRPLERIYARWEADAIADRNGNRRDRETGLGPQDESGGAGTAIAQPQVLS